MIYDFDVVVAGAGPAGISSAIAVARQGFKVAILERLGCVGGNLTGGCVGPIMGSVSKGTFGDEIIKLLGGEFYDFNKAKFLLHELLIKNNVDVFLFTTVSEVTTKDNFVKSIKAYGKTNNHVFNAKFFIDCTGDGDLCYKAGCEYKIGRDRDGLTQPVSLMYVIEGIDKNQTLTCCHEEHYTTLSNGKEYLSMCRQACKDGILPPSINIVRLYNNGKQGERIVNATQLNKVNVLDEYEIAKAELELRRQMVVVNEFLKKYVPGFENISVKSCSEFVGIRESRRILGEYVLTAEDCLSGKTFYDGIVHKADFPLDIHNPDGAGQSEQEGLPPTVTPYDIPYRCFTPKGFDNLFVAGRCISGDHRAHASYRVMRICLAMGQAVGVACGLCLKNQVTSKQLSTDLLRKTLTDMGIEL